MNRDPVDARPPCSEPRCEADAEFFGYDAGDAEWRPICDPHARHRHASLELHAWLESGYMKPVELGEPDGEPPEPRTERASEFRAAVEDAMDWAD